MTAANTLKDYQASLRSTAIVLRWFSWFLVLLGCGSITTSVLSVHAVYPKLEWPLINGPGIWAGALSMITGICGMVAYTRKGAYETFSMKKHMMVHQIVAVFSLVMISIAGTYVEWVIVACREQTMKRCIPTLDQHLLLLLVLTTAFIALILIIMCVELVVIMLFARLQGRVLAAMDQTGGEDNSVNLSTIKLNKEIA